MAEKRPYYITTAISYPNDAPHIGHAYEAVAKIHVPGGQYRRDIAAAAVQNLAAS